MDKNRKKAGLVFFYLLICLAMIWACGKPKEEEAPKIDEADKLILYTSHKAEVYEPIVREFEERTGIWVEVITGGTNELLERIKNEAGSSTADVMFGGGVDSLEAYSSYFETYVSKQKEDIDAAYQSKDNKYIVFSRIPMVLIYNKKLVYEKDIPRRWSDLLDKKWKGKIAFADPERSGSCYTALVTLIQVMSPKMTMEEVIGRFTDNLKGEQTTSSGNVIQEVESGNKCMGVVLEETVKKQLESCKDIGIITPQEGISMPPDGCAVIKHAPHQKNAALFMEFVVCEDVQRLLVDQLYRRSVRKTLETEGPKQEIIYDMDDAQKNREQLLKIWREKMKEEKR